MTGKQRFKTLQQGITLIELSVVCIVPTLQRGDAALDAPASSLTKPQR
ncbi:MAG: hypothetical protein WAV82_09055 [Methylobacter sp.]